MSLMLVHVDTHVPPPVPSALQQHCTIMHTSSPPPSLCLSLSVLLILAICLPKLGILLFIMGISPPPWECWKDFCASIVVSFLCVYMFLCGCPGTFLLCVCVCVYFLLISSFCDIGAHTHNARITANDLESKNSIMSE